MGAGRVAHAIRTGGARLVEIFRMRLAVRERGGVVMAFPGRILAPREPEESAEGGDTQKLPDCALLSA